MKTVTPIIKKTRVKTERYEVCQHCRQEIHEKSTYIDEENYVYHRPCMEKGPIDQITQQRMNAAWANAFGKPLSRAAQMANVSTHAGSFEKNVAGKNYKIEWRAKLATDGTRTQDDVIVDKPDSMPEYLWYQVKDSMQVEADKAALVAQKSGQPVQTASVKKASNWLERSIKTAEVFDGDDSWEFESKSWDAHESALATAEEKAKKQQKFVIESRDNSQSEWMPSSARTGFSNLEEAVSMILKIVKRHSGEPHNEYRVLDYTGDVVWLSPTAEDEDGRLDFEEPVPTVGRDLAIPDRTNIQDGRQNWTRERWEEAAGYGERESYLVAAIRQHLITEEQRRELFNRNVTIEDMLNGRVEGEDAEEFTGRLYADWNAKLGWHEFGY